jgi:adenylate cyclase
MAEIRSLRDCLAGARDWDVLLNDILPSVTKGAAGAPAPFPRLKDVVASIDADRDREAATDAASPSTARIALALGQWLCSPPGVPEGARTATVGMLWPQVLARLKRRIKKRLRETTPDDPATFHALRIAVRRARYAIECLAPLQPHRRTGRRLAALVELQEQLGRINDDATGARLVREATGVHPDDRQLAGEAAFVEGYLTAAARSGMRAVPDLVRRALRTL